MKRVSIKTKLIFFSSVLMAAVAIVLSWYFLTSASNLLHNELEKKGIEVVRNLSYTAREGILTKNLFKELNPLIEATMCDRDIVYVAVVDREGMVLVHSKPEETGKIYKDELTKRAFLSQKPACLKEAQGIITIGAVVEIGEKGTTPLEMTQEMEQEEKGPIGVILIGISLKNLYLKMNNILKISLPITIGLIIIGIIFAFLFSKRIIKPIISIAETSHAISNGDLTKRVEVKTHDEIGELAASFNQMTENLRDTLDKLEKSKREIEEESLELAIGLSEHFEVLRKVASGDLNVNAPLTSKNELLVKLGEVINHTIANLKIFADEVTVKKELDQIFNLTASAIRVIDTDFNVIKANERIARLIGSNNESLSGVKCYDQFKTDFCHTEQCPLKRILAGEEIIEGEIEHVMLSGEKIHCLFKAVPFCNQEGKIIGMFEDIRDITELKNLQREIQNTSMEMTRALSQHFEVLNKISHGDISEQAIEDSKIELIAELGQVINRTGRLITARIQELEAVNKELDAFTYSASHDLKEPLRGIQSFSQFILEDYADKLDDTGKDYLRRLSASANRMKSLIDDLLALSRISRIKNPYASVDTNKLVKEILKQLKPIIEEKNAKVEIDDELPFIYCDEVKIKQVFYNLISNAIKYNVQKPPKIEIGIEEQVVAGRTQSVFFVKDNGIGIEEKYFEEIFGIFKRLHQNNEYEGGTGIGLAIVKRVITDHGGKVWVQSPPGEGSTFYFSLPGKEEVTGNR